MHEAETKRIEGLDYRTEHPVAIGVKRGIIQSVERIQADGHLPWLAPGLVDMQVNGFCGVDFNALPLSSEAVFALTRRLWREGVTAYLPTVVTNSDSRIEGALESIAAAIRHNPVLAKMIPEIHLEGPFISPVDGPRGAHDRAYVKAPDWDLFQRWQRAAEGRVRLVTVSPEWPEATAFIERLVACGIRVAIGHTAANSEQIAAAVRAGASASTHLGNGSHPVLPRHPNYIWDQLADDHLWAGLIADGFHLPDSVLKVAMRTKRDKAILVSDVVHLGGLQPGEYETHIGGAVVLTPTGKLHLKDEPLLLAGSVQTLRQGVWNLCRKRLCSLQDAWEMASTRPATYLGLPARQGLAVGAPADIAVFEMNEQDLQIVRTIKDGFTLYEANAAETGGGAHA